MARNLLNVLNPAEAVETRSKKAPVSKRQFEDDAIPEDAAVSALPRVVVGRIAATVKSRGALVDFPGNDSGELLLARSLLPTSDADVGCEVALAFEDGDPLRPIILGVLQALSTNDSRRNVKLDEDRLVLSATREVVIQCGKSSITLTSAGKVLIRGAYLLSRSSGVNRIKGGSVQIN